MEYIDQSLNDLKMNIILNQFDISLLNIVEEETIKVGNFIIRASIIGASHAISFIDAKTNKILFTEVVANVDTKKEFPKKVKNVYFHKILKSSIKEFSMKLDKFSKNIDYSISFEKIETSNNKEVDNVLSLKDDNNLYLSFTFSKKDENETVDARTVVIVKISDKVSEYVDIEIETIHVYPNENQSLRTFSKIKLKENIMQEKIMIDAKELIERINKAGLGENESQIIDIIYSMTKGEEFIGNSKENQKNDEILEELSKVTNEATETLKKSVDKLEKNLKEGVDNLKEKVNSDEVQNSLKQVKDGVNGLLNGFLKSNETKDNKEK